MFVSTVKLLVTDKVLGQFTFSLVLPNWIVFAIDVVAKKPITVEFETPPVIELEQPI